MKRVIIIFALSILLTGCNNAFSDVTEIETVNLQNGDSAIIPKESKDAEKILDAINKKDKSQDDISSLLKYEIILKKDNNKEVYKLYLDLDNLAAYLAKDETLYKVKDNAAKPLFLSDAFSYIYLSSIYESYIELNGEKLSPDIEYNWNSKNIEGHFVNNKGILTGNHKNNNKIQVSQTGSIDIIHEKQPDNQVIRIYNQGSLINTGKDLQDLINNIKSDGEYYIECESQWHYKEGLKSYGSKTLKFTASVDIPADINIITKENYPGNILLISVENLNADETIKLITDAVKIDNDIYTYKDKNYYVIPIDLYIQAGEHKVTAVVNEGRENEYTLERTLIVLNKGFKTQYLTVSEEMNETNNDNTAIYEFVQLVKPARTESVKEKLWEGTFIMPVEGELTTDFAEIRYVNNEPSSSRHSGLDLAAPKGTPVMAPNNGRVTFSMEGLLSPGNTVVIDHGMGLFTSYYHLDTINVKKGDQVKKGDIIGTVGTTGFSTGPHLHYAVSIYNTYVNPYQTLSGIID
ncbi:MAG: M23 family metallopeptidase [Tissierellia bacterium]|nr:M23 family metallopeptidase [Tissierellia bacterium]